MTSVEEFNCILCKQSFGNKDELQIHFRKHGDPKFNESIKIKGRIPNETPLVNEKSYDASEMVNCDVCEEVFPTISKAITHKHKVHPEHDAKYFCPWCGKLFTMKHLYNKHLQTNHDAVEEIPENDDSHFHCDCCEVYFYVPAAMVYHNKFFHRQDTDLPIIGHSKKQKFCSQELLPVYYCSFCGEEYINKVNLHKHICDDHGDENQRPSDVMRCPLCEAIFYHLDAYELHLTFHSSEDLYSETNEMNENDISEFSLETVPPVMERVEDLNNLPNVETDVNAIGIENFLQMAMDEPHDNDQVSKRVKSKKHKKHKKSKKSAITLDEFLNMNQDVFGEDLDFQGVEEVPTKVITRQLKPKKPQIQKAGVKLVSSADLQKLQKQGIVVKMKSGTRPSLLQGRPVGRPVKVSPHVKNLPSQSTTKSISASNEVLSKLINQSSNQLKIVKKPALETANNDENSINGSVLEDTKKGLDSVVSENMDINYSEDKKYDERTDFTPIENQNPIQNNFINKDGSASEVNQESIQCITGSIDKKEIKQDVNTFSNETDDDISQTFTHHTKTANLHQCASSGDDMNDTFKNIRKQITIKPVSQTASTPRLQSASNKSLSPKIVVDTHIENELKSNQIQENTKNKTLDALKCINSAITIKSLKNKGVTIMDEKSEQSPVNISENLVPVQQLKMENPDETIVNKHESIIEKRVSISPSSNVLKNLSKSITIKSMSPLVKQSREINITNKEPNESKFDSHEDVKPIEKNDMKVVSTTLNILESNQSPRQKLNLDISKPTFHSPSANSRMVTDTENKNSDCEQYSSDEDSKKAKINPSNNILKHLKNITAKPVQPAKNIHQHVTAGSTNTTITNIAKSSDFYKQSVQKKEISEEIEIYNIDDSDSDGAEVKYPNNDQNKSIPKNKLPIKSEVKSNAALNVIRNLSKYVTVKSSNSQIKNVADSAIDENRDDAAFSDEDEFHHNAINSRFDDFEGILANNANKIMPVHNVSMKKDEAFKSVFKNINKHITVKSRNAPPSPSLNSFNQALQDSNRNVALNDDQSDDTEPCFGKVKITEITEDTGSDDDIDDTYTCQNKRIVTQSSDNSNSGNEYVTEDTEECDEHEKSKVASKIIKTSNPIIKSTSECLLKNISKNITVRSLSERTFENDGRTANTTLRNKDKVIDQNKLSKELPIRPLKQNQPETQNENAISRNRTIVLNKRPEAASSSSQTVNPNIANSPSLVNTVNKEVKVNTFQSETVIEEITTTVTKTIRRVNQVNQQVYNTSQTSAPRIVQQKNGPRMPKNVQGITVRQASPGIVAPRIRQAAPFRPAIGTSVRPPNQLVPIRPNANFVRPNNNPRLQIKNMPRQQSPVGKLLKISPNALNQTLKRPGTEEMSGPFSCFKKPKESLFPVTETLHESGSDFHCASSSQTSKFCSTTKTIKGSAVITSKQLKSECISQQQQISRNANVSGIKMAKAKQVAQVDTSEISASRRTTLEAIEKLQKQGLLVKKPRVEEEGSPPTGGDDSDDFQDDDE